MTDETRLALLEQSHTHLNETLNRIESKLEKLDSRFDSISEKADGHLKWLAGTIMTLGLALAGWIHIH